MNFVSQSPVSDPLHSLKLPLAFPLYLMVMVYEVRRVKNGTNSFNVCFLG